MLISLSGFSAELEPHLTWAWCVSLFCGFFSAFVLAVSPPKSCVLLLLWSPKEALEGTPPAPANCAALPAEAGGSNGGDGAGIVLLSPA